MYPFSTVIPIAAILVLIFIVGCRQRQSAKEKLIQVSKNETYANRLMNAGFLRYANTVAIDSMRTELTKNFNIYDDSNYKIAHIDAEELAEFSFDFFMPAIDKMLAKRNIRITVKKLNDIDESNRILVNGDTVQLYTKKELKDEIFWDSAPRNFFSKLNDILKAHNSSEKFYLLYDGNDLHTMLLTDEQYAIIAEYYKEKEDEKPYLP